MANRDDYYGIILDASRGEDVRDAIVECFKTFEIEKAKPRVNFVPDGSSCLMTADGKIFKCIV